MAIGSASETEYYLLLSHELGYVDKPQYQELANQVEEVQRMLSGLFDRLSVGERDADG